MEPVFKDEVAENKKRKYGFYALSQLCICAAMEKGKENHVPFANTPGTLFFRDVEVFEEGSISVGGPRN